ncbi:DNA-binding Lrp family transcriptional regulator [Kutzneria viridogrisea]|uniref:DNA-binding Lrp family transcriptional regulator n=1 Tax=Kutzneria viridogrisea TaxID=47990 RepID=A0ABR6BN36_9PSEU|nr:Lrp/AsnC family transcriptional regulator [Kutzneria albida]MBA8928278.1 DNA-binding Lrp family transcriptional regulator [Kutzneria viridogrisea]
MTLNTLDLRVLRELVRRPRIGVTELASLLGIARNTAHARANRLEREQVVGHRGRAVDVSAMGFEVTAFVTLEVAQGRLHSAVAGLKTVPFVLEAHGIAGAGDLLVRVVARSTGHLHEVLDAVLACPGVLRSNTAIVMTEQIAYRVDPLFDTVEPGTTSPLS